MGYLAGAVAMYVWSMEAVRSTPPQGVREIASVLVLCLGLAAMWPVVLLWSMATAKPRGR